LPFFNGCAILYPTDQTTKEKITMTYSFRPQGVCAREMQVELNDQGVIEYLQVVGGCNGNLKGISALVRGMSAQEAVRRLKGLECGGKGTSCPDQLACGLERILTESGK
jgi:uncharacterized protein (TIGR03905 family)